MPGVFGDQHAGDRRLGRQAAFDQPLGRWRLNHGLLASPACIFRTAGHERPELCRDHVQPLGNVRADRMHRRAAARAGPVPGFDRHMNAGKMSGQRATGRPALRDSRHGGRAVPPVIRGFTGRDRLLDVFQRQGELVRIELLGFSAKLHP
jgi:hypothetical protein